LTKEEHDQFMDASGIFLQDEEERVSIEREYYETGLQKTIMQFERQYNLRNQKLPPNPPKGNPSKEAQNNIPYSSQPKNDYATKDSIAKDSIVKYSTTKDTMEKGKPKEEPQKKLLIRK
jgi:hypothetical protein